MSSDIESRAIWDPLIAASLPGKILLVGITYLGEQGEFIEQQQLFGQVQRANSRSGIVIALGGGRAGEAYTLPPDTRSINKAALGEYRLRSTGEVVVNPDYTAMFVVHRPAG